MRDRCVSSAADDALLVAPKSPSRVVVISALGACLDNSGLWWRRLLELDSVCL